MTTTGVLIFLTAAFALDPPMGDRRAVYHEYIHDKDGDGKWDASDDPSTPNVNEAEYKVRILIEGPRQAGGKYTVYIHAYLDGAKWNKETIPRVDGDLKFNEDIMVGSNSKKGEVCGQVFFYPRPNGTTLEYWFDATDPADLLPKWEEGPGDEDDVSLKKIKGETYSV